MNEQKTFDGLGISPQLRGIIDSLHFIEPTPIQARAIPLASEGQDLIGIAQTGTGKTLAFGIPLIQRLMGGPGAALILVPTRELALQVDESLAKVCRTLPIASAVLIGGTAMNPQIAALRRRPRIVVATPGRLIDHLESRTFTLRDINILVLDEADRMLDMGFLPQIKKILSAVPPVRQTMLFSATLSREIMAIASSYMKLPVSIEIAPQGTTADRVTQEIFIVPKQAKLALLEKVLTEHRGPTLVFTRTKFGAKRVMQSLKRIGHSAAEMHSNRSLNQRREALDGFKKGKYRILVATDIAARGIDVTGIELVVNYDLPQQSADYVHRIGRTARAGQAGHAISFALPEERRDIRDIERLTKKSMQVSPLPEGLRMQAPASIEERGERRSGGFNRHSNHPVHSGGRRPQQHSRPHGGASRGGGGTRGRRPPRRPKKMHIEWKI